MSLGLATADQKAIYLATESYGTLSQDTVLPRKLFILQDKPIIAIIVTGGLGHWSEVKRCYNQKHTIEEARDHIITLLEGCTDASNEAYALLCGYNNQEARCYRINRSGGRTEHKFESLDGVVAIGSYAEDAKKCAEQNMHCNRNALQALSDAISFLMPREFLQYPVVTETLNKA